MWFVSWCYIIDCVKDSENDPETGCVLCLSTSELFLLNAHTGVPSAVNVFMKLLTTVFVFALVA